MFSTLQGMMNSGILNRSQFRTCSGSVKIGMLADWPLLIGVGKLVETKVKGGRRRRRKKIDVPCVSRNWVGVLVTEELSWPATSVFPLRTAACYSTTLRERHSSINMVVFASWGEWWFKAKLRVRRRFQKRWKKDFTLRERHSSVNTVVVFASWREWWFKTKLRIRRRFKKRLYVSKGLIMKDWTSNVECRIANWSSVDELLKQGDGCLWTTRRIGNKRGWRSFGSFQRGRCGRE